MDKYPIYVTQHNHFDPLWHRCWDRTYDFRGRRYRSYADVEEYVIDIWLDNAKRGATFTEGQSAIFRKYLERNPKRLNEMRQLVKKGQIELIACGETIVDTNMLSGETLLRNLILGQRYFEDTFGVIPTIGSLEDAFGHSAQIPQLFRGIECKMVTGIVRIKVPGNYWKGLDGSVVFTGWPVPHQHAGHCEKIPPCPECDGVGCEQCHDRGFADKALISDESIWQGLSADYSPGPIGFMTIGGEEAIANPRLPELVEKARKELGRDIHMGTFAAAMDFHSQFIDAVDDPNLEVSDQVESNPVFTGCYVSRIRVKQEMRRIENLVNTAERWATVAHLLGTEYPTEELLSAWRDTVFVGFHDAITSTHMDQPYCELLDILSEAESEAEGVLEHALHTIESQIPGDDEKLRLVVYNAESWERSDPVTVTIADTRGIPQLLSPSGEEIEILDASATGTDMTMTFRPNVPALGYTAIEVVPDAQPLNSGIVTAGPAEIENEFYKIKVADKGIESIVDRRTGRTISGRYLINELILEEDIGDPWGTMQHPSFETPLGQYTTGVKIRRAGNVSEIIITGQYKGDDPNTKILSWRQSMVLYKSHDRLDFHTEVNWDTAQRRIRVAFPTGLKKDEATYSIPYGALERANYQPDIEPDRARNGDWPAVNWVDVHDETHDYGVALLNMGTPSHKVLDGVMFMSLLRSPTDPFCLNEPQYYDCPDFDGARDPGTHDFHYSLLPHQGDFRKAGIEKRGRELNNPMICRDLGHASRGKLALNHSFVDLQATDNVIVTALKKADRDDSVVVRLAETDGLPGEASISLERAGKKAELVNFLERHPEPVNGKITVEPFKILTVKLSK